LGKATTSIEIEASPEKVFDFIISDKGNDIMMKDTAEGNWTSEKPIGLGSTAHFVGVHKRNKGEEWNAKVTEFVKNKSLTMLLKGANAHTHDQTNYYTVEPTAKGTKLTFSMDYQISRLLDVLVARRMIKGWLAKMMDNVKQAVEA
jgi:hypothetical protein